MAGYLKKKLMESLNGNGNNGELSLREVRSAFGRFRLKNKDFYPICKELEKEGIVKVKGKFEKMKIIIIKGIKI